jgi:hypothetical protein
MYATVLLGLLWTVHPCGTDAVGHRLPPLASESDRMAEEDDARL